MTTTKNRYLILAAAAALSFTLASCSGDDGGAEETTDGTDTTVEETTDAAEETTEAAEEGGDDAAAAGGAACLIGNWEMTPEAVEEQALALVGGEGEVNVDGTTSATFDEDSFSRADDYTATMSIDVQGVTSESTTEANGSLDIGYTADDTTITLGEVISADGTMTVTAEATGEIEVPYADSAAALAGTTMDYTCSDAELTITTSAQGIEVTQIYTRAG